MIDYCLPETTEHINKVQYQWQSMELLVYADRLTDAGSAELWFYHMNDKGNSLLHATKANLLSTSTMNQIAKRLQEHSNDLPWKQILTCISSMTLEYQRRGEASSIIQPLTMDIGHPGYFIEPIILKGVPSIIYGDKGVNKTNLCLALIGLVCAGSDDNLMGFKANRATPGMLDWESNRDLTYYNTSRLVEGGTCPYFELPYLRCGLSLCDDIERVSNFITEHGINLILIDSLGQAAGSDRFDSSGKAGALRFFEVLRRLNVTPLIIAQNAKNEDNRKTIFGSAFFTYYARNIFELKGKIDEMNEDKSHLALIHKESNYSKRYPPIGFLCTYSDTTINIESEIVSLSEFFEKASQTKAVIEFLKTGGSKSRQGIGIELSISDNQVGVLLNRLQKRGLVVNLGAGMWGLRQEDS